jgi:hypothetical protein
MFNELVGATIKSVVVSEEGTRLTFTTTDRVYRYDAFADCCSESWIESTDPLEELAGTTVLRIEQSPTQEVEGTRQEVDDIDFVTFLTDKGYWKLEFRNSSNGCYGGYMELVKDNAEAPE